MIAVDDQVAAGTAVGSLTKGHRLPMMTPAAILCRIGRVDFDKRSASFFRFARELPKELRPCRVTDAFCQTMVMNHPVHVKIFDTDHPEAIDDLTARLVGEIVTPERDPLMHPRYDFTMLAALRRAPGQFGILALHLGPRLFLVAEKARILDLFRRGEGGKGLESDIDPHRFGR